MPEGRPHPPRKIKDCPLAWLIFVLILLIAFFFRFYRLADQPLGIFFDPAINGLDAVRLMQRGGHVLFFPTNGGRESLFIYLLIPFLWLFDTTPFAIRALTASLGLLNVALLIGFLSHLPQTTLPQTSEVGKSVPFMTIDQYRLWLAILGGLALAVSYWHIAVTRLGQRPILAPMLAVPLFWFFLKGWSSGQTRWFILSGILMGLEGYTYSAARLLPLILIITFLPEVLLNTALIYNRKRLINLLVFVAVAAVVYLPMAGYLVAYPAQFFARAASVMVWNFLDTPSAVIAELGRNALRVAGFFCCGGSPNPIFGFPNYPGLPFILTPLLIVGLGVGLKNWRTPFQRLVVLWWLIGIAPSIIAIEAPHPLRMIIAVAPTAILIALGAIHLTRWLYSQLRPTTPNAQRPIKFLWLSFLLLLLPTPHLFQTYFIRWPALQTTQGVYDYGAIAIRDTILARREEGLPIYLPLERFNASTLLYYLSGSYARRADLIIAPVEEALVIAPDKNRADAVWVRLFKGEATILPPLTPRGQHLVQAALGEPAAQPVRTESGEIIARLAHLGEDPAGYIQEPTRTVNAGLGSTRLTGAAYPIELNSDTTHIPVTLFWKTRAPLKEEYEVILHLVDDQRRSYGSGDARPNGWVYPTSFWRPGSDHIAAQQVIEVKAQPLPPGRFWLAVSLLDPAVNRRLPLTTGVSEAPDTVFIGPLKAPLPSPPTNLIDALRSAPPLAEKRVIFGDQIQLTGLTVDQTGEEISLNLLWNTLAPPHQDYTVFIHLLDEADNLVAGHDTPPVAGRYPTTLWTVGEQIYDPHTLSLPADLPAGVYRLALGLYHQPSGQRLPLNIEKNNPDANRRLVLPQPIVINR